MGTKKGHTKYIESPEALWTLFTLYIKNEQNNPMTKVEYVGKEGRIEHTPLETPITFEGFECYLADQGIIQDLGHYVANRDKKYTDYVTILARIRRNCFVHNFKGASVGLFNANLIARKLGLTEKQEITTDQPNEMKITVVKGKKK
jgi:hypothetical protein